MLPKPIRPSTRPLEPVERHDRRHLPAAGLHQLVGERDLARQRQQQRHGVVGHFAQAIVRHVGDRDAELRRRRQVDVVDAEPEAADRLAARELAQQLAGQLGVGDEHGVGVARDRQDVVGRRRSSPCAARDRARASAALAGSSEGNGLSVTAIRDGAWDSELVAVAAPRGLTKFGGRRPSSNARMLSTTIFAISSRTSTVALPRCGASTTFVILRSAGIDLRLVLEHVEAGAGDPAAPSARAPAPPRRRSGRARC